METIKMFRTESIATAQGSRLFLIGSTYEVDDWIARSLVGRGYASLVDAGSPASGDVVVEKSAYDFDSLTIGQLRDLAKKEGVPAFRKLSRQELIDQLSPILNPPALSPLSNSFQSLNLTGAKHPPEFRSS